MAQMDLMAAERQAAMSGGHGVLVEALAGSGTAAGFIAVMRRYAREAASGTGGRGNRGIGIKPRPGGKAVPAGKAVRSTAGVVGMMMTVMVVMMMPMGSGRGFGDASTDQESCGEKS